VTTTALGPTAPVWSPDGSQIAFTDSDTRGMNDVWTVPVGGGPGRRITTGTNAQRVRWDWQSPGAMFVSGFWHEPRLSVRLVTVEGRTLPLPGGTVSLGPTLLHADFDVSRDGRFLAYGSENARGDVWLSEARRGRY
jgi:dipeptidyl aminopeptidase/acylaminoacyl peptidase